MTLHSLPCAPPSDTDTSRRCQQQHECSRRAGAAPFCYALPPCPPASACSPLYHIPLSPSCRLAGPHLKPLPKIRTGSRYNTHAAAPALFARVCFLAKQPHCPACPHSTTHAAILSTGFNSTLYACPDALMALCGHPLWSQNCPTCPTLNMPPFVPAVSVAPLHSLPQCS